MSSLGRDRSCNTKMAASTNRILLAFDFDHTLIAENSDITVTRLAPEGKLPKEIEDKYSSQGWTEYMGTVFQYLHSHGVTAAQLQDCMHRIPLTEGMRELMDFVNQEPHKYDMIIISDSNSVFIHYCLENFGLKDRFHRVFTNPAQYNAQGCLTIQYYHFQDWCELSTVNLCKGHILQEYIKSRQQKDGVHYSTVLYVGDGSNDLCPGLTLSSKDFLCPRVGFALLRKIEKMKAKEKKKAEEEMRKAKEQAKGLEEKMEAPEEKVKPPERRQGPGETTRSREEKRSTSEGQPSKDNGHTLKAKVVPWESGQDLVLLLQEIQSGNRVSSAF